MSATTFLLILAAVVVVFIGFVIKSWSELSNVTRRAGEKKRLHDEEQDQADDD